MSAIIVLPIFMVENFKDKALMYYINSIDMTLIVSENDKLNDLNPKFEKGEPVVLSIRRDVQQNMAYLFPAKEINEKYYKNKTACLVDSTVEGKVYTRICLVKAEI